MTFAELIEEVLQNISLNPGRDLVQRGEVKRLLNLAMREVSLLVGLPTHYIEVPTAVGALVSGSFRLPPNIHPEGVKYVEVVEVSDIDASGWAASLQDRKLPIMSVGAANEMFPRWEHEDYKGEPFILYNPASPEDGFRPVGFQSARYRLLVHANPEPMVEDLDQPFAVVDCCPTPPVRREGAMPSYHRVIAHFATHELLQRLGDMQGASVYFARYREMRDNLYANIEPPVVYLPTLTSRRLGRNRGRGRPYGVA